MLPVSQAVQASKATMARAADTPDAAPGAGFADLLRGMSAPPATPPAAGATGGAATLPAAAAGNTAAAGNAGGTTAGNGPPGAPAGASTGGNAGSGAVAGQTGDDRHTADDPASASAPAGGSGSGTRSGAASGGPPAASDPTAPRARRGAMALSADGGTAAAAAAAAQQALAMQQGRMTAASGAAGGRATGQATGSPALAGSAPDVPGLATAQAGAGWLDPLPAGGSSAGADGNAFAASLLSAQDNGAPAAKASAHGIGGRDDARGGRPVDDGGTNAILGSGLSALLARQGAGASGGLAGGMAGSTGSAGLASAAGLASRAAAAGDGSQDAGALYTQLMTGTGTAALPAQGADAAGVATLAIAPAFGDERWTAALGQQALFMARNQFSSAQLTVSPPDLGPIQITLDLNHDQANAMFVSPHEAVRQAIEASLPQLRDMFSAAGLQLSNAHVQADAGGGAWTTGSGQGQGQAAAGGGGRPAGAGTSSGAGSLAATASVRITRGLLDTFA